MNGKRNAAKAVRLLALALALAMLLTGCGENLFGALNVTDAVDTAEEADPQATMEPMTAEMFTDRGAVYQYYNDVQFSDTLDSLTERYGEPKVEETENGETYTWIMEDGYGFVCVFFPTGRLRAKMVYYEDLRQFGLLSKTTGIENVASLSKSYTFEMVCGILGGRAMELMQAAQDSSAEPEIKRLFAWVTEKGDCAQLMFSGDEKLESVSYLMAD